MQQHDEDVVDSKAEDSSLLDCYRIAVDFGMPAALKAYEKLAQEPSAKLNKNDSD